jgi:capsular polysaccharide biosynthesis protein
VRVNALFLLWQKLRRAAGLGLFATIRLFISSDSALAHYALNVARFLSPSYGNTGLYPVVWASSTNAGLLEILAGEESAVSCGPKIGNVSIIKPVKVPAITLSLHENVGVCAESSSILVNGKCIIEDIKGIDRKRCDYASGHVLVHGEKLALVRTSNCEVVKKGIFLGGNGSFNYYHWIIEILPKLEYLQTLGQFDDFPLLVNGQFEKIPSFREALDAVGNKRNIVFLDKEKTYQVGELLFISAVNNCPFNLRGREELDVADFIFRPSSISLLQQKFGACFGVGKVSPSPSLRLFLARGNARRDYNQEEIFSLFEEQGFQKVYMETLSLKEQYHLMASAEMVAGPSGAAWTNLLFCRPGTTCISWLAEESSGFSAYSNLASLAGAKMHYLTYMVGTKATGEHYRRNYILDVDSTRALLNHVLKS